MTLLGWLGRVMQHSPLPDEQARELLRERTRDHDEEGIRCAVEHLGEMRTDFVSDRALR